jgi:ArpU family phage transcriptional regulator
MMATVSEKEIQNTIINELRDYRSLKVKLENLRERGEKGASDLFPVLEDTYSTSELKVVQIDRALKYSLDQTEREIIEKKYLTDDEKKDIEIYLDLGLSKKKFYDKKREAIFRLARALGIV